MKNETEIKSLKTLLSKYDEEYDKIEEDHWKINYQMIDDKIEYDQQNRYNELLEETKEVREKLNEVYFKLKVLEPIIFNDLDDIGDHMTYEDFKDCCNSGGFIDYDGYGYYSTIDKQSNKTIKPSDIKKGRLLNNKIFTHIRWYNR